MTKKHIVIIGGGYGGLASAALLSASGNEVTVLEKNEQLGGRAGQLVQDGFRFDTGPSWYLMPEVFEQFYKLIGRNVRNELSLVKLQPGYSVFFPDMSRVTITGDLSFDGDTFENLEKGAKKTLARYVHNSQKIYDISVRNVLYNTYENMNWIFAKPLLRAIPQFIRMSSQSLDRYVSRHFRDSRIKRILEYHSVFLGTSPYKAPAIYSLMSTLDFKSGVYYPKKGIYSLVENMISIGESYGVQYRPNTEVREIQIKEGRAEGVVTSSGEVIKADIVIADADLYHTETTLIPKHYQSYPESYWKRREASPSALLLSFGIKGKLEAIGHHTLYFVDEWKENFEAIYGTKEIPSNPSLYICKPSATDPTAAPVDHENVFILVPLPSGKSLSPSQVADLRSHCLKILGRMCGDTTIESRIVTEDIVPPQLFGNRFNAWQNNSLGGQSHILRQSAFFRTRNKSKKVSNLYYVGAGSNPGIGLPMCLISAQLVYKHLYDIHENGPLEALIKEPIR